MGMEYAGTMSFGLGHGRQLDDAPGTIGLTEAELPPLPDAIMTDPEAGRIDPRAWFERIAAGSESRGTQSQRALEIEIGCGKGGFILQESAAHPEVDYLGIEYAREFYLYTADRLRRRMTTNVRMLHANASDFLRWRCPAGIVRVIHLYFSDPWPKTKHHKNRVIQDRFLADVWRVLVPPSRLGEPSHPRPGGELRVVTDHDELWAWDQVHFERWTRPDAPWPAGMLMGGGDHAPFVQRPFVAPTWADEGETVGTNYERKMCGDRPPHACVLVKDGGATRPYGGLNREG